MRVGILLIATRNYKQFVQPLLDGIKSHFLPEHDIEVFLFTDEIDEYFGNDRVKVEQILIPDYKFPYATLYRYKIFDENSERLMGMDYLFYSDVDMSIVSRVGNEILGEGLTVTHHPGFYTSSGWGSNGVVKESLAFVKHENRKEYFAGGFQGGATAEYLTLSNILNVRIQDDESREVMAEHHDESHFNWYMKQMSNKGTQLAIKLSPSYCMVEQKNLRELWGINNLEPRIVALAKNHKEIRS